jgi:hypothetical protein
MASPDASGDFTIRFAVADPTDEVQPTMLLGQLNPLETILLPFTVSPAGGITVSVIEMAANDSCANSLTISDGVTGFSTDNATTDGPSHPGSACDVGGSSTVRNDVWYDYVSSCSGILSASTCGTANFDTRVAIYDGCACPASDVNLLACNDDASGCGSTSEVVVNGVIQGSCYKIRLGATGDVTGVGNVTVTCIGNDLCGNADPVVEGTTLQGSTRFTAVNDNFGLDCGAGLVDSPGVWYSVVGTGDRLRASLPAASYDTRLTVYQGACNTLTCVGDADNIGGSQESISWCSTFGTPYLILVHGNGGANGTFTLNIPDVACDDNNACTDDSCGGGICFNDPNFDGTLFCCAPPTRVLTPIDDANPCTDDICNADGSVDHDPVPDGLNAGCDDALACTLDECINGLCANTDINTITCQNDLDCPGEATCGDGSGETLLGLCFCDSSTPLALIAEPGSLPVPGCYDTTDLLTVRVEMGVSESPIVGAQIFLEYDPVTLDFLGIDPGAAVDPNSPFALELRGMVDEALGTIDYMVGVNFGSPTTGPATVAVMTFDVLAECDAFVRYRPFGPSGQPNLLTDEGGQQIDPNLVNLPPIAIDAGPPLLTGCPGDIIVAPDPGLLTAVVTWPPPTGSDSCSAGIILVSCNPSAGSAFPPGTTPVVCTTTDSCGRSDACTFNVVVQPSVLIAEVELSAAVAPGPFDRCITFDLWDCDGPPGADHVTIAQTLTFTNGVAGGVSLQIPGGAWECITARDELHTLRSTAPDFFTSDGVNYTASFLGPRAQSGHWLVGGNLNDDDYIDILDFGVLFPMHLSLAAPNTPCGTPPPDANINGDNLVDLLDLVIFVGNSLEAAEPNCCGLGSTAGASGPIPAISVERLRELGLEYMIEADVNRDGILDFTDVAAFLRGDQPPTDDDVSHEKPRRRRTRNGRERSGSR